MLQHFLQVVRRYNVSYKLYDLCFSFILVLFLGCFPNGTFLFFPDPFRFFFFRLRETWHTGRIIDGTGFSLSHDSVAPIFYENPFSRKKRSYWLENVRKKISSF